MKSTADSQRRRWLARVVLVIVSVAFSLLVAEVGLRVYEGYRTYRVVKVLSSSELPKNEPVSLGQLIRPNPNPKITYELKPNIQASFKDVEVKTNSLGFRNPEVTEKSKTRIVAVGDSVMFGWGVLQSETYCARLENLLPVEVVNTGVPGYNTVQEVATLRAKGLGLEPDIVIIEFVFNDFQLPNFLLRPSATSLEHSFLMDLWKQGETPPWGHSLGMRWATPEMRSGKDRISTYDFMLGWEPFERALRELHSLQEAGQFEVIWLTSVPQDAPIGTRALELAEELGFAVLDVRPEFRRVAGPEMSNYLSSPYARSETDAHPSSKGHELIAKELAKYLKERKMVP